MSRCASSGYIARPYQPIANELNTLLRRNHNV
jgi:hypothetical protein